MDILEYWNIQNNLNGYKHITDEYFPALGQHLWNKFANVYNHNMLAFYNYLDSENRMKFKQMIFKEFGVVV